LLSDPDVVIIGAGAAGLAAGRVLMAAGAFTVVLEAKIRTGGRAFTDENSVGIAWDRGAHWLHNQRHNFFAGYAEREKIPLEPVSENRKIWTDRGWSDDELIQDYDAYCDLAFDRIAALGLEPVDHPVSDALPRHHFYRPMFESWYAALSGMEPNRSSAWDDWRYRDDTGNRRVRCGYGALLARYATDVPVEVSTPARIIDSSGPEIFVETDRGRIKASAVIITVSNAVLSSDAISFSPPLPNAFTSALECIPLGEAEKVAIAFKSDVFGLEDTHLIFLDPSPQVARFQIRPFGENIAVAYLAGCFARRMSEAGAAAMSDFALSRLVDVFGSGIRSAVTATQASDWCIDPDIGGGYSSARPGGADGRTVLAEPVNERLFFAGEAHAVDAYGTVHGAYNSGVETARRVLAHLRS